MGLVIKSFFYYAIRGEVKYNLDYNLYVIPKYKYQNFYNNDIEYTDLSLSWLGLKANWIHV